MRQTGTMIAGLLLLFGIDASNALEPIPSAMAVAVQDKEKTEDQDKDKKQESKKEDSAKKDDDDDKPEKEETKAEEEVVSTPALDAVKSLAKAYKDQYDLFLKATKEKSFSKEYREASGEGREAVAAFLKKKGQPDRTRYAAEMEEVLVQSMAWMAANGPAAKRNAAMAYLFENCTDNACMELVVESAGFGIPPTESEKRFRKLINDNPSKKVQGLATMALADLLARGDEPDTDEIEELYQTVVDEYAKVESSRGGLIADRAKTSLFELQYLTVGKEAPEITAEDLDGVEFKLTDYRGKVVLLDFWGNW